MSLDGEALGPGRADRPGGELGAEHGVGIVDHIEDRIVGLKVRDLYEVPAAAIMLTAHAELEKLVSTIHQNNFKGALESHWAYLCYAGLWLEPLRLDLDAYMDSANEYVTGAVTVRLHKGPAAPSLAARRTRCMTARSRPSASPAASSPSRRARGSSSCSRCRAGWRSASAAPEWVKGNE